LEVSERIDGGQDGSKTQNDRSKDRKSAGRALVSIGSGRAAGIGTLVSRGGRRSVAVSLDKVDVDTL
jgi:hypothetical protein